MKESVKKGKKKGLWTQEEDTILLDYVRVHGRGRWNRIPKVTGLKRCGKSCRLRWLNYLSPNVKRGDFTEEEEDLIIRLHNLLGNRWSLIAGRVPGRTDNQVKNHWNTHLCKKLGLHKQVRNTMSFSNAKHSTELQELDNNSELLHNNQVVTNEESFIGVGETTLNINETTLLEQHGADAPLFYHDLFNLNSPGLVDFLVGCTSDLFWHN